MALFKDMALLRNSMSEMLVGAMLRRCLRGRSHVSTAPDIASGRGLGRRRESPPQSVLPLWQASRRPAVLLD
jgi:hypothetical protein